MTQTTEVFPEKEPAAIRKYWESIESGEAHGHHYVVLLGLRTFDTAQLLKRVLEGLSISAWERFARNTAIPTSQLLSSVQISSRTITRRREEGRLHPDESDRLLRVTRVYAKALALFDGDAKLTRHWLLSPQLALGDATPLDYAATEVGANEVENLIGRLEHGIPS